jgi:PKD repeat protein
MASSASAVLVRGHGNVLGRPKVLSITLVAGKTAASLPPSSLFKPAAQSPVPPVGNLDYNGGGVFHSQAPYVVFWDPLSNISAATKSLIERYFTDLAHDSGMSGNVYGAVRQYYDSHGFADYAQTFSVGTQALVDTTPYPAKDCTNTGSEPSGDLCILDSDVTAELGNFINAHGLPNDGPDPTALPANAPEYFVVLPSNVNECSSAGVCADNQFCAYHSAFQFGSNGIVYSMIPLMGSAISYGVGSPGKGCQADGNSPTIEKPNGDQQGDISIKYISHEQIESITDPLPPQSWFNNEQGGSGGEIGDECNATGSFDPIVHGTNPNAFAPTLGGSAGAGTLFDQLINANQYYIQSEWSNGDGDCKLRPSSGTMTSSLTGPTTPTPVGTPVTLTPGGSSSNGYSSALIDFGDGTTGFEHSAAAPGPASHTYSHAGFFTAKLSAVDPMGNITQASSNQLTIGSPPNAAFSLSRSKVATGVPVRFNASGSSDPDTGISLTQFAFAFGDGRSATGATATHTYSKAGTRKVTLALTNSLNLQSLVTHTITIVPATIKRIKLGKVTSTSAIIIVTINAPGKLIGIGKTKRAKKPGTYKLTFKRTGARVVTLKLKFAPAAGKPVTKTLKLTF